MCNALLCADVSLELVKKLCNNLADKINVDELNKVRNKKMHIYSVLNEELVLMLSSHSLVQNKLYKRKLNILILLGLQGSGKTTTCAKLANYHICRGWRTAIVCTDTFRAGAYDQLHQLAVKNRIPFYGNRTQSDPTAIAIAGINTFANDYNMIIIDTSGRHKQERALFEELSDLISVVSEEYTPQLLYVLDSLNGQVVRDQVRAFREWFDIGELIITKLDNNNKGGGALTAVCELRCPITFVCDGEHIRDIQPFNTRQFVERLLGKGDLGRGLRMLEKKFKNDRNVESINMNILSGKFNLSDMYDMCNIFMNMKDIKQFLGIFPSALVKNFKGFDGTLMKKYSIIMDSMTKHELDNPGCLGGSRKVRIAKGSGRTVKDVDDMIKQYNLFKKLFMPKNIGRTMQMFKKNMNII